MINRDLLEWINKNKDTKSETEIKNELMKQNWRLADINKALDETYGRYDNKKLSKQQGINEGLLKWVKSVKETKSETEIKNILMKQNWKLDVINEALDVAYGRKIMAGIPKKGTPLQKVCIYSSNAAYKRDLKRWNDLGWVVVSHSIQKEPYGAYWTCCLAIIFLPLALFGGEKKSYVTVTYEYRGKPGGVKSS